MNSNLSKKQVLVIGAGIGGIATAAQLARHGYQVTVVEKNEIPGGRCGRLNLQGYCFDTGATIFLMPELYAEAFAALGERVEDHLDLRRIDPTYHLFFQDNSKLQLSSDLQSMLTQLEAIEPGSFKRMLHYLAEGRRMYELSLHDLVGRDFRNLFQFINPRMLLLFLRLKAITPHSRFISRYFKHPKLEMAFTFQDMYMSLSPYESPAVYSLMQYTELADGLHYPIGGMYRIAERLTAIAEKLGVEFLYNTPVEKILVDGNRATGLALADGRTLTADIIVANADLGYVYRSLLPNDGSSARLDRKEYGCSTIMFYWGLDRQYPQLGPHNLFMCGDYRKSFVDIFKRNTMPARPNFYIHVPSRLDPSVASPGGDTWYIAIPVGHIDENTPQDWPALQKQARAFILQRLAQLGMADIESHIKVERSFLPPDWKNRYNLTRGSAHGLSHKMTQMAYFRPHNRHRRYHNLYFTGASTHPGTGVPTVLVSARLAAERILDENG